MRGRRVLYISYNGISEPLVRSQVLKYLAQLAGFGHRFVLLTYESAKPSDTGLIRRSLAERGIDWRWIRRSSGTGLWGALSNLIRGLRSVLGICRSVDVEIIHARSFLPGLVGRIAGALRGLPLIFDMRGFWVDEKACGGQLNAGSVLFRMGKFAERWIVRGASRVVSLTKSAVPIIEKMFADYERDPERIQVIPTCVDLSEFQRIDTERQRGLVLCYSGSLGPAYLPEQIFAFFARAIRLAPGSRLLVLSHADPEGIKAIVAKMQVPDGSFEVVQATPSEMPAYLSRCDAGLSFRSGFAKVASFPTKVGEYLACGLPIISTPGIGDVDELLVENGVGVIVHGFRSVQMDAAFESVVALLARPLVREKCRSVAESELALDRGVQSYDALYESVWRSNNV